jgi:hypothetical protein
MADGGLGATIVEYVVTVVSVAVGTLVAVRTFQDCYGDFGGSQSTEKGVGCFLCGALAGVTAGLLVYLVFNPVFLKGVKLSTASQLRHIVMRLKSGKVPPETIRVAIWALVVQMVCTERSLRG